MPVFEVELSDGRVVELEADREPSEDEVLSAVGQFRVPESEWTFPELPSPPHAEPPEPTATALTGFGEELRQNAGDIFRSGLRFIPSTLRDLGVAQTRLDQGGRYDPVLGRTVTSREMAQERAAAFPGTPVPIPPSVATPESHPLYRAGEKVESMLEDLFPRADVPDLATSIREGFGQVGSMLATGGAAKGLRLGRVGATTAATTLGGVMEFDDAFQRARARKDNPDTAFAKALGYTTVASLLENRLGAGRLLRQLMPSAAEAAKKLTALGVSKRILGNFISGGAEEGGQRLAQNWIVEGEPSMEGVMDEALPGAIVEGVLGLPGAGVRPPTRERKADALDRKTETVLRTLQQPEVPQEGAQPLPAAEARPEVAEALEPQNAPSSASPPSKEAAVEPTKVGEPTAAKESVESQIRSVMADRERAIELSPKPTTKQEAMLEGDPFLEGQTKWDPVTQEAITLANTRISDLIQEAVASKQPIPAEITDLQFPIPEGYVLEGNRYVFNPQPLRAENAPGRKVEAVEAAPRTKAALIDEILGTKPAQNVANVEARVRWDKDAKELSKRTRDELATIASDKKIAETRETELADATRKIIPEVDAVAKAAGQRWRTALREKADAEGVRFPTAKAMTRGDVVYYVSRAIAEKNRAKPAPKAETPKPTETVAPVRKNYLETQREKMEADAARAKRVAEEESQRQTQQEAEAAPVVEALRQVTGERDPKTGLASGRGGNIWSESVDGKFSQAQLNAARSWLIRNGVSDTRLLRAVEGANPKPTETPGGEAPAAGYFPRVSETVGMGEPSMPPTLEDVRQQRAREAAPAAPGAKTKESGGVWFAGKNPQETAAMMQARATAFLKGKTDQQAIAELTDLAGGDPNIQLDNQAANFVIKDLLVRASDRAQKTTNPVEAVEAWAAVDRLAELSRRLGSEDARSLVSRKLAYRQIDWLMPVLAWRGIVKDQWRKALGLEEGQPLNESVITPEEAKKRGLPELNGEQTRKITKLSKEAEKLPQGIRRNKVMDEMVKEIQKGAPVSKLDLLRDIWYASVLARFGTFLNVLAGSYATGASFTAMAALDRAVRLHPVQAMRIVGQFIGGTYEGALIAKEIASKGAWHLLPDAELRFSNLLSGKAGTRYDNLEEMLRRRNPLGILAYTRRFMTALDYIGAEGTRDSQLLYAALTRNDQESLDALGKRFDKNQNARAAVQARLEMGPKASRAEVLVRKREILEEGVSEELQAAAINTARRSAQNANPRGIPGIIYQAASKLPFWFKAPTGLAFIRAGMNMVQNAVDYMPVLGAVSATRGRIGALPKNHPLQRMGVGLDIPIEERRMMWAAQGASLGIAAIAAAMFLGDDEDDEGWEISGSWAGVSPSQRKQLMELGERPNSIRFGKKGPWISFKQMPFAPPLAIVGTMRDEERFHAKDWNAESAASKMTSAWLSGLLYIRDLSALSGIAGMFDANAWNTQEKPTKLTERLNRWAAQSVGRAVSGYIPSVIKEIDEFFDTKLYRPSKDEIAGWWIRNVPYARRTVGPGPALNNFGEPVQMTPPPIKSWAGFGKDNDLYKTLGALATKGIFLPEPGRTTLIVDTAGKRREMTEEEWYQFIKIRGPLFKRVFNPTRLQWLKTTKDENVKEFLKEASQEASAEAKDRRWPAPKSR